MAAGDLLSNIELVSPSEFAKQKIKSIQEYSLLAARSIGNLFKRPLYVADMIQQADMIGVGSLPIVLLTGFFTGAVLALNTAASLGRFGALSLIGQLVSISMVRELGPVLTGLMVAGRVGSGIAAQLGTMRVTEQIDALNTLGTDPIKKLVTPRVLGALVMVPVLTIINDFIGILGGNVIAKFYLGKPSALYWKTVCVSSRTILFRDL